MATLQYDFSIVGTRAIDRAFASIERRAVQHNLRMSKEFGGVGSGRAGGGAGSAGKQYGPSAAQLYKLDEQQRKRALASELAAEKAAAREKVRLDKWRQDMRNRHWQEEARNRQRAEAAEARASARAMAERRRSAGALFGRIGDSARSTTRAIGATATGALAIGGGFMASAAVGQQMRETATASKLANQAGDPSLKAGLLKQAQGIRGFTGEEAMGGLSAFVEKTGDLASGRAMLEEMSKMALAFNTDLEDIGRTAGQAFTVLEDQVGTQAAIKQTTELLKTLAQQGNLGAVEMSDLARVFGKLGAASRSFEGGAPELLRQMGAFAQIAVDKGGASSSEEAATAVSRLAQDMVGEKRTKFEKILGKGGLQSKADKSKLRDPLEIMIDVLNKTGGDIMKTGNLFGGESKKVFAGLSATYGAAEAQKKGSGEKAVRAEFEKFAGATKTDEQVDAAVRSRMSDPDMQFKQVMKDFNAQVGSELLPVITKLIPEFAKLLPHVTTAARIFGKMIESFADSPLTSIGQMIAAKVALDIATARIGDSVRNALTDSIAGGDGSGAKGGAGLGGAASLGLSLGALTALTIYSTGVVHFEASEVQMDRAGERVTKSREIHAAVATGQMTKEEGAKQIDALFKEQRADTEKITESNEAAKKTVTGIDSFLNAVLPGWMTGDVVSKDTPNGIMGGEDGIATSFAETLGMINEGQQKTNESFEASIKQLLIAVGKLSGSADKLDAAGDKLSTAPIATPNRPAAPSI